LSSTQGDPDDPDAGNLASLRDDPDSSSLQRIEHLIGIYGPTHITNLYCKLCTSSAGTAMAGRGRRLQMKSEAISEHIIITFSRNMTPDSIC